MIDADVAAAIDGEAVPCVRHRGPSTAGAYDAAGKWVPAVGAAGDDIMAAVQPATGRQLLDMPEGIRPQAQFITWSRSSIALDDRITTADGIYRVVFIWPRPADGFTRAAMGLVT